MFTDVHLWLRRPLLFFASSREKTDASAKHERTKFPIHGLDGMAGLATFSAPVWTSG
jgi:hypothetical protein